MATVSGEQSDREPSSGVWVWVLVIALMGFFCGRLVLAAWDKSAANDEPKHLISGLAYLESGLCCIGGNNTLLTAQSALPDWILGPAQPAYGETAIHLRYFRARLMNLPLAILLGLTVFVWSRRLFGQGGALLSISVFAFSPNMVAHAALVSPDFQVTALMLPAAYACRSLICKTWTVGRVWWAALLFAGAQIAKYTALCLLPVFALAPLFSTVSFKERFRLIGVILAIMTMGFGIIGMLYDGPSLISDQRITKELYVELVKEQARLPASVDTMIAGYESGTLPTGYLKGLLNARHSLRIGYGTYLNGQVSPARWLYYPEVFLIKTPLSTLFLLFVAIAGILRWLRKGRVDGVLLLLPPLLLATAALTSSLQLGLRHLLPAYPFLFVAIGGSAPAFMGRWWRRLLLMPVLGLMIHAGISCHPHYLAYFNQTVGGPSNGHRYLVMENLDWGQDLRRLAQYQKSKEIDSLWFHYYGSVLPLHYGVKSRPLPGLNMPVSGWIAVSLTPYMAEAENAPIGKPWPPELRGLSWLDPFEPEVILGYSILVYHITEQDLERVGLKGR